MRTCPVILHPKVFFLLNDASGFLSTNIFRGLGFRRAAFPFAVRPVAIGLDCLSYKPARYPIKALKTQELSLLAINRSRPRRWKMARSERPLGGAAFGVRGQSDKIPDDRVVQWPFCANTQELSELLYRRELQLRPNGSRNCVSTGSQAMCRPGSLSTDEPNFKPDGDVLQSERKAPSR